MSTVIDTLITDRTVFDVQYAIAQAQKGFAAMTADEKAEYLAGLKGVYEYVDRNRVGQALIYLEALLAEKDYGVVLPSTPKTDWTRADIPSESQLADYLANIVAIRNWLIDINEAQAQVLPSLPATMRYITYIDANAIEEILIAAQEFIDSIVAVECGMGVQAGVVWEQIT